MLLCVCLGNEVHLLCVIIQVSLANLAGQIVSKS